MIISADDNIDPLFDNAQFVGEDAITPMNLLDAYASIKLSVADSARGCGASGNFEARKLADMNKRTDFCMMRIMEEEAKTRGKGTSVQADGHDPLLEEKISFVTTELIKCRGQSALQIASNKEIKLNDLYKNFDLLSGKATGKFAESNLRQANGLLHAAVVVYGNAFRLGEKSFLQAFSGDAEECRANYASFCNAMKDMDQGSQWLLGSMLKMLGNKDSFSLLRSLLGTNVNDVSLQQECYMVYDATKTPNRKTDANGNIMCYTLSVYCYPHEKLPFRITLDTYRGKPADRGVGIVAGSRVPAYNSKGVQIPKFAVNMETWEWNDLIESACLHKAIASEYAYRTSYPAACQIDEYNRQHSQKEKATA